MRVACALVALLLLATGQASAAGPRLELSRNADLLVPGRGSDLLHPPKERAPSKQAAPSMPGKSIRIPVLCGGAEILQVRMGEDLSVPAEDLREWIAARMDDEAVRSFAAAKAVRAEGGTPYGFSFSYDSENAVLRLDPDPRRLKARALSFSPEADGDEDALRPAAASAFLNLRAAGSYAESSSGEGRAPLRLDLDGAASRKGFVLEAAGDWLEDDAHPFKRGDARLVHDLPDKMVRLAAGDLSYPVEGFQSYSRIFGLSGARDFDLQPYRVTEPSGADAFTVLSPSTADVYINGARVRTLKLDPGPYDAADFPVESGANDVRLVITDSSGRVEERRISVFSDQKLLKAGLHAYAYNLGISSRDNGRRIDYDTGGPAFSLFHRYGFSDAFTAGIAAQGDDGVQQAGLMAVRAFRSATLSAETFASILDGHGFSAAHAANLSVRDRWARRDFSVTARYRGASFAALGMTAPQDQPKIEAAARLSQTFPRDIALSLGGQVRRMRGARNDEWSAGASLFKALPRGLSLSASCERRRGGRGGVMLNAVWSPRESSHTYSTTIDTATRTRSADWRYRSPRALQSLRADAGLARAPGRTTATGGLAYTGYRGEASLRHDLVTSVPGQDSRNLTSLFAGTAVAYAGGRFAFTRPVGSSFIMVAPDRTLRRELGGRGLGVNPETASAPGGMSGGDAWQGRIDAFGPAVLPDAVAYMRRPVRIDTRGLPPEFDIDRDAFTALPAYKSGVLLEVGGAAQVTADGRLLFGDGTPAALAGGIAEKDGEEIEFFTNDNGRFRIARLKPGRWRLTLHDRPAAFAVIDIPQDAPPGRFSSGEVTLQ